MNKSIKQSWRIFNNIKLYPLGEIEETCPRDKHEAAEWADKQWNHLVNDDIDRAAIFVKRGKGTDKYTISVWNDGATVYLIAALRTEYNTDSIAIYLQPYSQDNLSDFVNLAKFIHKNISAITGHSIKGHQELQKLLEQARQDKVIADATAKA